MEVKFRLIGDTDKKQFNISAIFKDVTRANKNSFITVEWSKNLLYVAGNNYNVTCGNEFRTFRIIIDRAKNRYTVYDMDNGGKEAGSFVLMTGSPAHKPCAVSFGDGSSSIEGKVELEYLKVAFDRTYYPKLAK